RGDAAMERNLDHVVRRLGPGARRRHVDERIVRRRGTRRRRDVLRLPQHFERAGAVGQAADEAALLERRDQAMHAGLALEVERFLHLLERRGNSRLLQLALDEAKEFVLLGGQHEEALPNRSNSGTNEEQVSNSAARVKPLAET